MAAETRGKFLGLMGVIKMGTIQDVIDRLIMEPHRIADVKSPEIEQSKYEIGLVGARVQSEIVSRQIAGRIDCDVTEPVTSSRTTEISEPRQKSADTGKGEAHFRDADRSVAVALFDRSSAQTVNPAISQKTQPPPEVIRAKADVRHDLRRYSIGSGELGSIGVTPIEMSAFSPHPGGVRGKLINAIDEYVQYHQVRHTAGLIRQGISPR
jgi:hypothetical protein